jgi:hypothetical protein
VTARQPIERNPFSTCFVRPGALRYRFPPSAGVVPLVDQLQRHGWSAQIVGAHGSGKSTLLHTLAPELRRRGRDLAWLTLHAGQRSLGAEHWWSARRWNASTQVIVDGHEQLGPLARRRLHRLCRRTQGGLLITTHRPTRMPVLAHTGCGLAMVQQLVTELTAGCAPGRITPADVASCYAAHQANVRDTFFALYDLFEQRWRRCQCHGSERF